MFGRNFQKGSAVTSGSAGEQRPNHHHSHYNYDIEGMHDDGSYKLHTLWDLTMSCGLINTPRLITLF